MLRTILLLAAFFIGGIGVSLANEDAGRILRPDEMAAMSNGTYRPGASYGWGFFGKGDTILKTSERYNATLKWAHKTLWCADYVNLVLSEANVQGTRTRLARSFLHWGHNVNDSPQPGDVVVLSRGTRGSAGHVGFFVRYEGRKVVIHSGNTWTGRNSRLRTVAYGSYDRGRVLGIRRAPVMVASL